MQLLFLLFTLSSSTVDYKLYQISASTFNTRFEISKQAFSSPVLLAIKKSECPVFEFLDSKDYWSISADYVDSEGWINNRDTLIISIPMGISGNFCTGIFTDNPRLPFYSIKISNLSPSSCLSSCKNGGICIDGTCSCSKFYTGYDCAISLQLLKLDSTYEFSLSAKTWAFASLASSGTVKIVGNSFNDYSFRLFVTKADETNDLPTMFNSDSVWFEDSERSFTTFSTAGDDGLRIGIYCYQEDFCEGSLYFEEINSISLLWIIIFVVIAGILIVGSIPVILLYCYKNRSKLKIRSVQISKSQMEQMFPIREWEGDQKDVCAVCLDNLQGEILCRILACDHAFHEGCIDEWVLGNLNCPVCKQNIIVEYHNKDAIKSDMPVLQTCND